MGQLDCHLNRDSFYQQLFTCEPHWSSRFPNQDESLRAGKILPIVSSIAVEHYSKHDTLLRIIDVGCGRGWLTFLLSVFGDVIGIDPVPSVINFAKQLYPQLTFMELSPEQFLMEFPEQKFDVIVCSEVIEHVPKQAQSQFFLDLASILYDDGNLIITTPRGELFSHWSKSKYSQSRQPIESWLTEHELDVLAASSGFVIFQRDRCRPVSLPAVNPQKILQKFICMVCEHLRYKDVSSWSRMIYQVVWLKKL